LDFGDYTSEKPILEIGFLQFTKHQKKTIWWWLLEASFLLRIAKTE
jgi:hypothetical protein